MNPDNFVLVFNGLLAFVMCFVFFWLVQLETKSITISIKSEIEVAPIAPPSTISRCPPDFEMKENAARRKQKLLQACQENAHLIRIFESYSSLGYRRMAFAKKDLKVVYFGIHKNAHTGIQVYLSYWNTKKMNKLEGMTAKEIGKTNYCNEGSCFHMGWKVQNGTARMTRSELVNTTWRSYLKFTFIQEPLVRIVSGFFERLYFRIPGGKEKALFLITRPQLIDKAQLTLSEYWKKPENKPTLEELFRYLSQVENPKAENEHWMPQFFIWPFCQPEHFDFIGTVDKIGCQMEYLARNFSGKSQVPKFFLYENRMEAAKRADFLRAVPPELVRQVILKHYLLDYLIFGYDLPDFDNWNSTVDTLFGINN